MSGRTHQTRVGSSVSDVADIKSGVIQGSCLGPILFLLYINDIVDIFPEKVSIKLYADDVKLYSNVCTNTVTDNNTLQDQMNKPSRWAMD